MKKILLSVSFIFLIGLFPEQLFARELSRAEIDRLPFYDKSQIARAILIENDSERQRMLIEIKLLLSLHKYYSASTRSFSRSADDEYFIVYRATGSSEGVRILIAIESSRLEVTFYKSRENILGISEIVENTYDKIVESIEMFEFINGVNTSLVPPPGPIYEIDPSDIIPEVVEVVEYILVPAPERPSERQFDERTQLEYEVVGGRSVTITGCTRNATTVNIPSQIQGLPVTAIGKNAFSYCESLTSVTIPSSVTSIGDGAFFCCNLTSVTIPSSVTSIGRGAFYYCWSLTSITIPSSVTSIGSAFDYCSSLTSLTVDNRNPSYASIDGVLFDKNIRTIIRYPQGKNQSTYVIPSSVTTIGEGAFYLCDSLTSITIPSSVTLIGANAFSGCRLTSITIPSSVTSIEDDALSRNLTSILVDNRNPSYASIDGVLFDKNIRTLIIYPRYKNQSSYVIPSSVTSIEDYAFFKCSYLTSVTIPSSVMSIGDLAFFECNLTSVTIPSSVTSIGDYAFSYCDSLTSVTLSRRTQVGEDAFPETARIVYSD